MFKGGDGIAGARRCDMKSGRRRLDVITVAHPDGRTLAGRKSVEQYAVTRRPNLVAAVLSLPAARDFRAEKMGDELHPVTDTEHGCNVEQGEIGARRILPVDRVGSAAQDDAGGIPRSDPFDRAARWMDLRVDSRLAHAARDELRVLRAVIDDQDAALRRHVVQCAGSRLRNSTFFVSRSRIAAFGVP